MPDTGPRNHTADTAAGGRRGRPARLTQRQIVEAARAIVRRDGIAALTMRRLAEAIDSTPMALYGHVHGKEDLLLLVLDAEARELSLPELPGAPRERIITTALFIHDALADRPWALEAIRPGERFALATLPLAEEIIASFVACGLSATAAAHAYRSLWFLITGELLARHDPPHGTTARRLGEIDAATLPQVARLASQWKDTDRSYDITRPIIALVDGLVATERVDPRS